MPITFAEYQNLTVVSPLTQRVAYVIARESPVARRLPFEDVGDISVMMIENQGLPTPTHRALGGGLTDVRVPFGQRRETLKILSDRVQVDRQLRNNKSNVLDPLAAHVEGYSRSVAYELVNQLINGNPDTVIDEPAGLAFRFENDGRLSDGTTTPATQLRVVDANNQDADFAGANALRDRERLLNGIHEVLSIMDGGSADVMITNRQVILGLSQAARVGGTLFRQTSDQFDRPLLTFMGIPILDAGVQPAGVLNLTSQVIPTGSSAENDLTTDSIWFLKFGTQMFSGLQKGPLETIRFNPDADASSFPFHTVAFEWVYGFHLVNPFAVGLLRRAA